MNIISTRIPDILPSNLDESKISLANDIVSSIQPLFNETQSSKIEELNDLKKELIEKRHLVTENKNKLEHSIESFNKNKAIKKLLGKTSVLINSGLVYDSSIKTETIVRIKMAEKLSTEKILEQVSQVTSLIRKRF